MSNYHTKNDQNNSLEYADEKLKADKYFVLRAVKQDGYNLQYANKELQDDYDIVLAAIQQNGCALQFVSEINRTFALEAVKQTGHALQYTKKFIGDREVRSIAMRDIHGIEIGTKIKFFDEKDKFIEKLKKRPELIDSASDEFRNDKDIILVVVKENGLLLQYASEELKNDEDIVTAATKQQKISFYYASDNLQNNKEFITKLKKITEIPDKFNNKPIKKEPEESHIKTQKYHLQYGLIIIIFISFIYLILDIIKISISPYRLTG